MRIIYDNYHEPDMGKYHDALVVDDASGIAYLYDSCGVFTRLPQDAALKHNFTDETSIIVEHGLNKYPAITITDDSGDLVLGDVKYDSINKVTVTLSEPVTGFIALN